jgi:protein CpxP
MKISKISIITALALGGWLVSSTVLQAQDDKKQTPPAGGKSDAVRPSGERPQRPQMSPEQRLARISEQLSLTEDQKPKVKALLEEQSKSTAGFRDLSQEERRAKMQAAREEMTKKMKEILTEEQFQKWETMRQGRGPGGPGGPGGRPPGGPDAGDGVKPPADAPKAP